MRGKLGNMQYNISDWGRGKVYLQFGARKNGMESTPQREFVLLSVMTSLNSSSPAQVLTTVMTSLG